MTDYNDGNWHAWRGGECPVHPKSVVEVRFSRIMTKPELPAGAWKWAKMGSASDIIAFRVVTPYAEPAPETPVKPAKRDLRTIDEPFGELDERTQKRLRKAAKRGMPMQYKCEGGGWIPSNQTECDDDGYYRLDPTFKSPAKRATFWLTNGRVFQSAREAKTAYPGSDPVKVKECKK